MRIDIQDINNSYGKVKHKWFSNQVSAASGCEIICDMCVHMEITKATLNNWCVMESLKYRSMLLV